MSLLTSISLRAAAAALIAFVVAACAGGAGAGWTYAPLGPTASAGSSPAGSPGTSPAGSPAGSPGGAAITVETPADNQLAFVPNTLNAPANTSVSVTYTNNSALPHNIHFFNGADSSAPSLAMTEVVTGPNAPETATFTTPGPGDYFFWCDVHLQAMSGTLHVQ